MAPHQVLSEARLPYSFGSVPLSIGLSYIHLPPHPPRAAAPHTRRRARAQLRSPPCPCTTARHARHCHSTHARARKSGLPGKTGILSKYREICL